MFLVDMMLTAPIHVFSLTYLTFMKNTNSLQDVNQFCNLTYAMTACISISLFSGNFSGNGLTNNPRKALVADTNMLTGSNGLDKVWHVLDTWDKNKTTICYTLR